MATLEELDRQIAAADDLQSVVRTMKATSAAAIRQHEVADRAMRDYLATITAGLGVVLRALPDLPVALASAGGSAPGPSPAHGRDALVGVVLVGSEIGLCGGFNDRLVDHALHALDRMGIAAANRRTLTIGASFTASWQVAAGPPTITLAAPATLEALGAGVARVLHHLDQWQTGEGIRRIILFHQQPGPVFRGQPVQLDLHPLNPDWLAGLRATRWPTRQLPRTMGEPAAVLRHLVQQLLFARLHAAMIQSRTAEQAERLAAMQAADRSIAEKLDELRGTYQRQRQNAISMELLDLIAGFEAATGSEH